jgi:outer membrane receptor protein involved in Fe transport
VELALKDASTPLRSPRSFQNSLGVEQDLTRQVNVSVEGFFNLLDNLVTNAPGPNGLAMETNQGSGRIFGAELMLRYQPDSRFFGWLSYTLSRSERKWGDAAPLHLFSLDQTHILSALGTYTLGAGWDVGVRFRYVSGNLYTPCVGSIYSSAATDYLCISGAPFSRRMPPFHQLDLRVEKRFQLSRDARITAYADLINVYSRKNPDIIQYSYDFSESATQTASLPFVPSIGLRGEF